MKKIFILSLSVLLLGLNGCNLTGKKDSISPEDFISSFAKKDYDCFVYDNESQKSIETEYLLSGESTTTTTKIYSLGVYLKPDFSASASIDSTFEEGAGVQYGQQSTHNMSLINMNSTTKNSYEEKDFDPGLYTFNSEKVVNEEISSDVVNTVINEEFNSMDELYYSSFYKLINEAEEVEYSVLKDENELFVEITASQSQIKEIINEEFSDYTIESASCNYYIYFNAQGYAINYITVFRSKIKNDNIEFSYTLDLDNNYSYESVNKDDYTIEKLSEWAMNRYFKK